MLKDPKFMTQPIKIPTVRNYINGEWRESETINFLDVENPSTGEIIARVPMSTPDEVSHAIDIANEAYRKWSQVAAPRRVQPLFQLASFIRKNEEKIAHTIAEENGKSLPDALAEVKRTLENVEVACGTPVLQQGDKLVDASYGIDGEVLKLPRGVYTIIPPFNFPAMVPFWFLPYAIATGNTVVIKPSEQVPLTMQLMAELIDQTDLPAGVFNLVNGGREVSEVFMTHPKVVGVSMVGSSRVAKIVAETCARNGKRFQAMGGAKNHLVVMPDAKLDEVIRNMVTSCYGCAGQRCMASSAIIAVGEEMYRKVCDNFVEASKHVIVANPLDPKVANDPMVMGPVISAKAEKFIYEMIEKGVEEGATLAYDGHKVTFSGSENGHYIGPVVFADVKPGMEIHKTEIFGPVLVILKAESLDEAIQIINDHSYGNGASIYTQNGFWVRKFKMETQAGMIGVNVGIPAPVAALPFGGMKDSFFSETKAQGKSVINFFIEEKIITERYWPETE
jgi:malonate-semialdehyde dehydrogenase (acetylating)/methylmalonate-semialdehyde dehydrogenase